MANVIEIILEATDKTKGVLAGANSSLDDIKTGFEDLTGISLSTAGMFALAGTAVSAVVDYTKDAIDKTVEYADKVENLARVGGLSFEDASRLIQVAEGMGVSYKDLVTGLGNATKKGVDVSIENILLLADEYNKLNDPVTGPIDRARWLTDNFGAAGDELAPIFEAGRTRIVAAMDDVNEALVLDKESIQSVNDYELALKDLNDSFDGLKMKVGLEVIPTLLGFLDVLNNEQGARGTGFQRMFGEVETGAEDSAGKVGDLIDEIDKLEDKTVTITVVTNYEQQSYGEGGYIGYLENNAGVDMNGNGIIGKAVGGYVGGGNTYLVGERGPELFTPSGGGQITPNGQLGGGGMSQSDMAALARMFAVENAAALQKLIGTQ